MEINENYRILIIDDEPEFHRDIRNARPFRQNCTFEGVRNEAGIFELLERDTQFDIILLDLVLDENSKEKIGLELIGKIQVKCPNVPIVVVTNDNEIDTIIEATQRGADSFLYKGKYKPEDWDKRFREIIAKRALAQKNEELEKELSRKETELTAVKAKLDKFEYVNPDEMPLVGVSPQMEVLRRTLKTVADDPELTVLLTGETGVGKGVAARFLHYNSISRRDHPFEEVHIANIPETLRESTLFGALKGTFTDAKEDRKGRLHMADKGILFLDEIGELDRETQKKLLQFLQSKTIRPIGATKDLQLDVHIVAATNKNLREEVRLGNFRQDLYHRLKVVSVEILPLRERREDILPLIAHFLKTPENELGKIFAPGILNTLINEYDWVGNVRELENSLRSMRFQQRVLGSTKINFDCLPEEIRNFNATSAASASIYRPEPSGIRSTPAPVSTTFTGEIPMAENISEEIALDWLKAIERALKNKNGVKKDVAAELGWKSSDLIIYRIKSIHKKYPALTEKFPEIRKRYKRFFAGIKKKSKKEG